MKRLDTNQIVYEEMKACFPEIDDGEMAVLMNQARDHFNDLKEMAAQFPQEAVRLVIRRAAVDLRLLIRYGVKLNEG